MTCGARKVGWGGYCGGRRFWIADWGWILPNIDVESDNKEEEGTLFLMNFSLRIIRDALLAA